MPELPRPHFRLPPPPTRRIPDELRRDQQWPEPPNVELVYADHDVLHGSAAGQPVDLRLSVPHSHNGAQGTIGHSEVAVTWTIAHNSETHPDQPGTNNGTLAGTPVHLDGVFHIPGYQLDHADIVGTIADQPLTARIVPAADRYSTSAVAADGTYGPTPVTIYAAVNRTRTVIAGTVGEAPTRLELTVRRDRTAPSASSAATPDPWNC